MTAVLQLPSPPSADDGARRPSRADAGVPIALTPARDALAGVGPHRVLYQRTMRTARGETTVIVVERLDTPEEERVRARCRAHGLSRREAEVAALLAVRRTNPEIAAALAISLHTVRRHAERVFAKLAVTSRRDVAAALARDPAPK